MTVKIYRHKKTRALYGIICELKMKHPVTRKWVEAYLYHPLPTICVEKPECVREKTDFHERFVEVEVLHDY